MTCHRFFLKTFGETLRRLWDEVENGSGVLLLRGLDVDRYGLDGTRLVYWGIGAHVGTALAQNPQGALLVDVRNEGGDPYRDVKARGYHTSQYLPFHNDQGDVVGLLCFRAAKEGGESCIASSAAVYNEILRTRPDLLEELFRPYCVDIRDEQPAGRAPYYVEPRFAFHNGRFYAQHGPTYVKSAQRFDEVPRLTDAQLNIGRSDAGDGSVVRRQFQRCPFTRNWDRIGGTDRAKGRTMKRLAVAAFLALIGGTAMAEQVNITRDLPSVTVQTPSGPVEIKRNQDTAAVIEGEFARIARPCPDFCIQPMTPADGVETVGELEVLQALQDPDVVVVDGRVRPDWETGTIPGAISMPYTEAADRLDEFGCELDFEGFICDADKVPALVMFCNGPWCGQSPAAIRRIIAAGYPAEKISYYRWGMQGWRMLGLTVAGGS